MFGQAHSQAGILIEPKAEYGIDISDEHQLIKFRNLLWSVHSPGSWLLIERIILQADYT